MKKNILHLLFIICTISNCYAKYVGGFISAQNTSGYTYQISATTFVTPGSSSDVPALIIYYGDGDIDTIWRVNGSGTGVLIEENIKKNVYVGLHTYSGTGVFTISTNESNRASGIMNIPNSVNVPFYMETDLYVFNPLTDCISNTIDFDRLPIGNITTGNKYQSDLPITYTNNDSLSYNIVACKELGGFDISGYFIPVGFNINTTTGQLNWNSPGTGRWNFAIKIKKWRKGILVGSSLLDFLLEVSQDTKAPFYFNVSPPCAIDIDSNYICIVNPTNTLNITVSHPNSNIKEYSETNSIQNSSSIVANTDSINYTWTPNNADSRNFPYKITFRGSNIQGIDTVYRDYVYFIYVTGAVIDTCPIPPILNSITNDIVLNSFSHYPNPTTNQFTLEFDLTENKNTSIEIKNMLGQTMKKIDNSFSTGKNKIEIDVSEFSNGLYFIQLQNGDHAVSEKFVKHE